MTLIKQMQPADTPPLLLLLPPGPLLPPLSPVCCFLQSISFFFFYCIERFDGNQHIGEFQIACLSYNFSPFSLLYMFLSHMYSLSFSNRKKTFCYSPNSPCFPFFSPSPFVAVSCYQTTTILLPVVLKLIKRASWLVLQRVYMVFAGQQCFFLTCVFAQFMTQAVAKFATV